MIVNYKIHEVSEYINWIYFFHAWGFQPKFAAIADIHGCDSCRAMWLTGFAEEDRPKASEAMQLFKEANRMLNELDTAYQTHGVVNIMDANADGDDLLLNSKRFPLLRQQTAKLKEDDPFLCLSDFVRPLSSGITDKIGAFATTVDAEMERLYAEDDYKRMLVQTLSDWSLSLSAAVFYLTPVASDGFRSTLKPSAFDPAKKDGNLSAQIISQERPVSETAALNPDWVEWLMGFPKGWTDVSSGPPNRKESPA